MVDPSPESQPELMSQPQLMSQSDLILLEGLRVMAIVGVLPEEREREQLLQCDLALRVDLSAAGVSDDLNDTVDYGSMADAVVQTLRTAAPLLLERLAAQVASTVFAVDQRVESVEVILRKLHPPVPHDLASSAVRIIRRAGTSPQANQ